jgi:hypothetical protein
MRAEEHALDLDTMADDAAPADRRQSGIPRKPPRFLVRTNPSASQ